MFERFGEIKSCKVATNAATGQSKGYGFVWFKNEASCKSALNCKDAPYPIQLYQSICLRKIEAMSVPDKVVDQNQAKKVTITGLPRNFTESKLAELIGPETIQKIEISRSGLQAKVQFKTIQLAQQALILDGIPIKGQTISVKPLVVTPDN